MCIKIMKKIILILFLLSSVSVFAQKKSATKPNKPPIIEIEAVTNDGRSVVLSSDGTWRFSEKQSAIIKNENTLNIEAALVYKIGDVVPISRTNFYLLNQSAESLVLNDEMRNSFVNEYKQFSSRISPTIADTLLSSPNLIKISAFKEIHKPTACPIYSNKALKILTDAASYTNITDFNGKVSFPNVKPGNYFVFAVGTTRSGFVFWDLPITIESKSQNLVLDQNNAIYAK